MTEKRFTVHKTIGMFNCFYVNDNLTDKVVIDHILHKYESDRLCDKLNQLHDENEQLKSLNIPIEEIKDAVVDYKGRIVGVYYND